MTTVVDVARQAGVSPATVSRVLNGRSTVSAEVRDRVLDVIKTLDFRPNPMARGLRRGQANAIALLVGDIEQAYFAGLTKHVQEAIEAIGFDLLLYNLGHSEDRLRAFLERAVAMRLRGLIIASSDTLPTSVIPALRQVQDAGVFILSIGQNFDHHDIPSVIHDDRAAATRAVRHLVQEGRTAIAYVGRIEGSAVGTERFKGYRAALKAAGFDLRPELVWDVYFRYAAGRDAVARALDRGLRFDGIQAGSDELAIGAISALQDHGLRVPEDVAVIGFGNVELSAHLRPSLTTLSSHPDLAAERVREIFRLVAGGGEVPRLTLIQRCLVRRLSA